MIVVNLRITDNAVAVRVEILGRFAGSAVEELSQLWTQILQERSPRQLTVDITNLSGFDYIGCALLRNMHKHGVQMAAASASSLVFLAEISAPQRKGPTLVPSKPAPGKSAQEKILQPRPRFASGE